MVFEDRIQKNPRLLRLKNPETGEVINWEIQDLATDEIEQEGTEINAEIFNKLQEEIETIVETGTINGIMYKKYANGRLEQYGITNAIAIPAFGYNDICITLPLEFADSYTTICNVSMRTGGSQWAQVGYKIYPYENNKIYINNWNNSNANAENIVFQFSVFGRWK